MYMQLLLRLLVHMRIINHHIINQKILLRNSSECFDTEITKKLRNFQYHAKKLSYRKKV